MNPGGFEETDELTPEERARLAEEAREEITRQDQQRAAADKLNIDDKRE